MFYVLLVEFYFKLKLLSGAIRGLALSVSIRECDELLLFKSGDERGSIQPQGRYGRRRQIAKGTCMS